MDICHLVLFVGFGDQTSHF